MAKIVLTDDHVLLRNGLATLVTNLGHTVLYEADNGKDLIEKLKTGSIPDIVLLDINMPEMDGYATANWLKKNYPKIKVLALSMYDNETSIIRMLKAGAKGYILKDSDPADLKSAIESLMVKGFHYSDHVNSRMMNAMNQMDEESNSLKSLVLLSEREIDFLKNTCTELTYKEIAEKMIVSVRTIDGYRDRLFEKLDVKTRVGLVMYAIKNGIVSIN